MKKNIQIAAGFAIAAYLIWALFKNTDWSAVGEALRDARPGWLALAFALVFVTFVTRVFRWGYIVRTAQPVSFRAMFGATQIGFLANFTLPGRVGEVIRALALARLTRLTFSRCFAFVALDRVTDLVGLIATLLITIVFFNPTEPIPLEDFGITIQPAFIRWGAISTGGALFGIIACFVLLYLNKDLAARLVDATAGRVAPGIGARLRAMVEQFADGMHIFKSAGDMARAVGWSLVTWAIGTACYFSVLQAFSIDAPWYTAVVVMAFLALAISIPSTPGFVGPFHLAIVAALMVVAPETNLDVAKAAALMAHLVNVIPVWIAGGVCLYTENLGLFELRRESAHMAEE